MRLRAPPQTYANDVPSSAQNHESQAFASMFKKACRRFWDLFRVIPPGEHQPRRPPLNTSCNAQKATSPSSCIDNSTRESHEPYTTPSYTHACPTPDSMTTAPRPRKVCARQHGEVREIVRLSAVGKTVEAPRGVVRLGEATRHAAEASRQTRQQTIPAPRRQALESQRQTPHVSVALACAWPLSSSGLRRAAGCT